MACTGSGVQAKRLALNSTEIQSIEFLGENFAFDPRVLVFYFPIAGASVTYGPAQAMPSSVLTCMLRPETSFGRVVCSTNPGKACLGVGWNFDY